MSTQKKYAQVGLGSRSWMYSAAIVNTYADTCELVAVCDSNQGRLAQRVAWANSQDVEIPGYAAEDFDKMIAEAKPDTVIVTTKDDTHDDYICRAMELGCDVITEKPMTTDAEKCQRIIDTQKKTGQKVTVTFNYRYSPPRTQIKDLLMSGVIGDILSVDFHWVLDTRHGADYYRRWHRDKANSGGLMVHKATHHFDMVNWWLSSVPESVFARGQRKFYTPQQADRYGLTQRGERCHGCAEAHRCPFYLDMESKEGLKLLYLDNEQYDGYYRDRCVFSPDINIEDSMNVLVNYANGVQMTYSLNSFMPWEGYIIYFNGSKGRLEHKAQESVYISGDGTVPGALQKEGTWTRIYPHFAPAYEVEIWKAQGGHGGGDSPLLKDVFAPDPDEDKYKRAADHRAGAYSILTGIAANQSMDSNQLIQINDLVTGLDWPDYPPMPTPDEPMSLPE